MSWSQPANRRLLWSILHAPAQPVPGRTHISHTTGRSFCTSPSRCGTANSTFSFGPEGDNLIVELARKSRAGGNLAYPKTAKAVKNMKKRGVREKEVDAAKASDDVQILNSAGVERTQQHRIPSPDPVATTKPIGDVNTGRISDGEPPVPSTLKTAATDLGPQSLRNKLAADGSLYTDLKAKKQSQGQKTPNRKTLRSEARDKKARSSPPTATTDIANEKPPKDSVAAAAAARLEAAREANHTLPHWAIQKLALTAKFGAEGWNPRRKLSPDARLGIRTLHHDDPATFTTAVLARQFKISPEAIRRILKSNWLTKSGPEKVQELRERWAQRHDKIWDNKAALGLRPARGEGKEHRVRDAAEGADEVEHSLWAEETLERAREDNPLFQQRFQKKTGS